MRRLSVARKGEHRFFRPRSALLPVVGCALSNGFQSLIDRNNPHSLIFRHREQRSISGDGKVGFDSILDGPRVHHARVMRQRLGRTRTRYRSSIFPVIRRNSMPANSSMPTNSSMHHGRRSGKNKSATGQDRVQGPARHPETAGRDGTLLPTPVRKLYRSVAILLGRINNCTPQRGCGRAMGNLMAKSRHCPILSSTHEA